MRPAILRNLRPLGRAFHTASSPHASASRFGSRRLGVALGASVVTLAYLGWRAVAPERTVALEGRKVRSRWDDDPFPEEQTPEEPAPTSGEEDDKSGAFNPETGEINWDCPCLGGMAHGPCGEQFREAFSCFVFSEQEPKGVDCVEKFRAMQDCFRAHPDVYGEEIDDDEAETVDASVSGVESNADTPSPDTAPSPSLSSSNEPDAPISTDSTTSTRSA